ncbi:MAG: 4a-hydroxytetrahydrobiopterin dehydratase [Acidobacteria bacterium]|nr:4a-hydroxytetrahydrobiopterin dehydratase [Acidobacteriota bacterium]
MTGKEQLANRQCVPCRGGVPPLEGEELRRLQEQLPGWETVADHHLAKTFSFPDFSSALEFVNRIGAEAEAQGHHPDLLLSWGKVGVRIFTHKIDGLTESDFILAAPIDRLSAPPRP